MAASPARFSWAHARVVLTLDDTTEPMTHEDVRVVVSQMRRPQAGWFLRLFQPSTGRLLVKLPVATSEKVTKTRATVTGDGWSLSAKREGCNC